MGVFVRRAAEELIKSTIRGWKFLAESYGQCTSPEGSGVTILTNHMRENETCNRPRWTQMDTSAGKATNTILVASHQPWNTCVQTNTTVVVACPVLCSSSVKSAWRLKYCQRSLPGSAVLLNTKQRHQHAMQGVAFESDDTLTVSCRIQQRHGAHIA